VIRWKILLPLLALWLQLNRLYAGQDVGAAFDRIDKQVRDGLISRDEARQAFRDLLPALNRYCADKCPDASTSVSEWIFPVAGYRPSRSIGGKMGSGYTAKGYDYFDGKRHHAHPAHDIFIHDGNQDSLDDRTGKPVRVLSVADGIVVGVETRWDKGSDLRGGIYVLIYRPSTQDLFYYAHLRSVLVQLGDCIGPGQPIGEVGRTGKNASLSRSPTHLHFEQLRFFDAYPRPLNPYEQLVSAIRR
jgi:murein DD-endopeptidase MepM/ murein hydrolase activator NlpD